MDHAEKTGLRRAMYAYLKTIADTVEARSLSIRERLMSIETFRYAQKSERLMSFVSMPSEVNTAPLFTGPSMIVPYCEAGEIVPVRILSMNELEPAESMKILEPKLRVWQNVTRQIALEQISVVLVPGLAFDRFGNRLGRGRGHYDRFLHRLPASVLTIGLAFDGMMCDQVPHGENDYPVMMVVTENGLFTVPVSAPSAKEGG